MHTLPLSPASAASNPLVIFWFRRDLRLPDNAGLQHALKSGFPVLPVFLLDPETLPWLTVPEDRRIPFLHQALTNLETELQRFGSSLLVKHGTPQTVFQELTHTYSVAAVYTNRDYEPATIARDQGLAEALNRQGISFHTFKDHVIFEMQEVVKEEGTPYRVFGAYKRKWLQQLNPLSLQPYPTEPHTHAFFQTSPFPHPPLMESATEGIPVVFPAKVIQEEIIRNYGLTKDIPALEESTSRLGVHLRFGTVSIRQVARTAQSLSEAWFNQLIWRDFFAMLLFHFPHVAHTTFHRDYEAIPWSQDEEHFARWCEGTTGYPLVDAGMRELNTTGFMHNRVRMVVASFLVKHLLLDYRWGEAYFAEKLLDYDLATNNGNWQWCAGTGCDAAPYFRVFNPQTQAQRFDKQNQYIRKWVPEWGTPAYPAPLVDHTWARERVVSTYKKALALARYLP